MTINKEAWKKIAEKYDSKAKWADAILFLNLDDHEDLLSALIELDPSDVRGLISTEQITNVMNLDTSKIKVDDDEPAHIAKSLLRIIDRELGRNV